MTAQTRYNDHSSPSEPARAVSGSASAAAGPVGELVPLDRIRPAPENESLYARFDLRNDDDQGLYESVREHGILEPILVDADDVILSGHRRHNAAHAAKLALVPVRRGSFRLKDMQPVERLAVLSAYNTQRDKSAEEQAREALVTVPSVDAWQAIRDRIADRERAAYTRPANAMQIRGSSARCEITEAKRPMLDAVRKVVESRRAFWPLSVRQIHYALLNDPPLIHAGKPDSRYRNDIAKYAKASYRALVELCARARLAGLVPWEAVADETRPVELWRTHRTPGVYVAEEARYMLGCYRRDLMQSQVRHVEIVVEKNTAAEIVRRVACDFTIPVTSGHGFCSLEPRRKIAERFGASGKDGLMLVLVSDADPDGEEIAESLVRSLRDDFHVINVEAIRAALTPEQARAEGLPPNSDAKEHSSNFRKYRDRHGSSAVYELEAILPERLQTLVRTAIESVLDMVAYDREVETWKREASELETVRHRVVAAALKAKTGT